ncbi:hypothetical protein KBA27_00685 [bacterium]|nr:hypothetical protein [bacterium]
MKVRPNNTASISKAVQRPQYRIPLSSVELSPFTESPLVDSFNNKKRPLKTNSENLAFKGLSFKNVSYAEKDIKEAINIYEGIFGKSAGEKVREIESSLKTGKFDDVKFEKGQNGKDNQFTFKEKTTFKLFTESLVSPFTTIPLDITNYMFKVLDKHFNFGQTSIGKNLENLNILKKRRENDLHTTTMESFKEIIENVRDKKANLLFENGHTRLDSKMSNYSSDAERSLTRLVTGMTSAFFLANDSYNLSRVIKDDPITAEKDKKHRFNQEVARIGLTTYLTVITLGAMKKIVNKNAWATVAAVVGSAGISEVVGRLISGTPVLPVSEEKAKELAKKSNIEVKKIKEQREQDLDKINAFAAFNGSKNIDNKNEESQKDNGLKLSTALKILAGMAVGGFAIRKGRETKAYKDFTKSISDRIDKVISENETANSIKSKFTNWTTETHEYKAEDIKNVMDKLNNAGFEKLAKTYEKLLPEAKDGIVSFGKTDKKMYSRITNSIKFPFEFMWEKVILGPGKLVEKVVNSLTKGTQKEVKKAVLEKLEVADYTKNPKEFQKDITAEIKNKFGNKVSDEDINRIVAEQVNVKAKRIKTLLMNSIKLVNKTDEKDVKKVIGDKLFESMDTQGKSNYSNADIGASCKVWCSTITSLFLIADHYNLVMINSAGQDKKEAGIKAKERTLQRAFSIFYSKFTIQLGNTFFRDFYNASLPGSAAVNIATQTAMEVLTRKSIGMPVGESSKDEIYQTETKNQSAKGLKGGFFKAMAYVTGKKNISQQKQAKTEKEKSKVNNK